MDPNKPKVSVLVTSYNHGPFIEECLLSALHQRTTFPYEIVVSDDVSTDDTFNRIDRLAKKFSGRLQVIHRDKNLGNPENFIDCYKSCRGDYIAILDGDDYWTSVDKLQIQADALDAHPHWSGCFHRTVLRMELGLVTREFVAPTACPSEPTITDFLDAHYAYGQASMYRKHPTGSLPSHWCEKKLIADWPLSILHSTLGVVGFVPKTMSVYRIHRGGFWSSASSYDRIKMELTMLDSLAECLPNGLKPEIQAAKMGAIRRICERLDTCERSLALRMARFVGWPLDQMRSMFRKTA